MPLSVLSNISALRAQRALGDSSKVVGRAFERLSSGMRINRASDDAAGLAVSESLKVNSRVASTAVRNVSDGVSLLSIASGALDSISVLLTRMSELAEQAASGTLGDSQRDALQAEYTALSREVARISESTEFNGIKIFAGEKVSKDATAYGGKNSADAVSADGRYVIGRNAVLPTGLFLIDRQTGEESLLVNGSEYGSVSKVSADASGQRIIFRAGNELYLHDRTTGTTTQLTDAAAVGATETYVGATISADGNTVAFTAQTRYDSSGQAVSSGAAQITTIDLASSTYGSVASNVAFSTVPGAFTLSADGSYLAISSRLNLTGDNADLGGEVFLVDLQADSPQIEQVTDLTADANIFAAVVNNEGDVYFVTAANIGGANPGLAESVYEYDRGSGEISAEIQGTSGSIRTLTLSADG